MPTLLMYYILHPRAFVSWTWITGCEVLTSTHPVTQPEEVLPGGGPFLALIDEGRVRSFSGST